MPKTQLFIFMGIGIFLLGLVLVFFGILPGLKPSRPQPFTLEIWGMEDDESAWDGIIRRFQEENTHITIKYTRFNEETFEETLINRLAENKGPDIFMLKNSSILKNRDKIFPLPQKELNFSSRDFPKIFTEKTAEDLINPKGEIIGLPLFTDTLALFYNRDIFNAAGISEPPKTQEEIVDISRKLTQINPAAADIVRSGLALGSFDNVEHALEIISSFVLQKGERVINPKTGDVELREGAKDAFLFYTSFADESSRNFSWTSRFPNSLDALAEEKTAMAIGFAKDIKRVIAKNPHLNLGVAPFPQPKDARLPLSYTSYFFPTVSNFSRHPLESWQFILFAVSRDNSKEYLEKTNRPPARRDLINQKPKDPQLEVFYRQSLVAASWPIPDYGAVNRIFGDALKSVLREKNVSKATEKLGNQLKLLLP